MADMISMSEADARYGKKNSTNAGLTTGIIGTSLAGLLLLGAHKGKGLFGNVLGGGDCGGPTAWEAWQKEADDNIALTRGIYDMRIKDLEEKQGIYNFFNAKFCEVDRRVFALEQAIPYEKQILDLKFQLSTAYTNEKFVEANNHCDQLNCRNLKGELVLPNTPVVQGYGSYYPPCSPCK